MEIIRKQPVETQQELAIALKEHGFKVTQATISRDIKELGLPLYGKLIEVAPYWITIERKDGSSRIISKGRIMGIEPVRDQPC